MKKECSLIISLVALTLSIVAIFGIHQNIVSLPDLVLTLLGVCATIIVGVSVISALELLQVTRKLKEIDQIQSEVNHAKTKMESMRNKANMVMHVACGLALKDWQPSTTIAECLKGFDIAIHSNDAPNAHFCLDTLEKVIRRFQNDETILNSLNERNMDKIPKGIPEEYKKLKLYKVFEKQLENVFKDIDNFRSNVNIG